VSGKADDFALPSDTVGKHIGLDTSQQLQSSLHTALLLRLKRSLRRPPGERANMREIAILPRQGFEVGMELFASVSYLRSMGIHPRSAITGQACAVVWVDDEEIWVSVDLLRNNGFEAAYVTETDVPS
jgi:hypothetical protein